jgi:hypothetical protein
MDGIASASYHVTMLRACALMSGFADVLLMPDCSVYLPLLLQCTTQRDVLECRFAQQQSVSQRAVMLLEMHSGAIFFVTTLFRAHQLFDYFLCSLQ